MGIAQLLKSAFGLTLQLDALKMASGAAGRVLLADTNGYVIPGTPPAPTAGSVTFLGTIYSNSASIATASSPIPDTNIGSNAGSAFAFLLPPSASAAGRRLVYKNGIGSGNMTLTPNGSDTVNGAASYVVTPPNKVVEVQLVGTDWVVIRVSTVP